MDLRRLFIEQNPNLIKTIIQFTSHSIREVSSQCDVPPSSLSQYLRGIKYGYISREKLMDIYNFLGMDESGSKLGPGIHRWIAKSPLSEDIDQIEAAVRMLLPGGGLVVQVRRTGTIFDLLNTPGHTPWLPWIAWVLVPARYPDVRMVLRIGSAPKQLIKLFARRSYKPENFGLGWMWKEKGDPASDNVEKWVELPHDAYTRIVEDESLKVQDLDSLIGLQNSERSMNWTWERLKAAMEEKGIGPEEIARKFNL